MVRSISKDVYAGIMFVLFGGTAMMLATGYRIGTAARMGPGYFPFSLGALLVALGAAIIVINLTKNRAARVPVAIQFKPPAIVLSSVVLFGLLLQPLGLILSTLVLVLLASMASHEFRWREALINAAALGVVVLIVFVYLLKFQVPVWPALPSLRP